MAGGDEMTKWNPNDYFKNASAIDYQSFLRGAEAYQEWLKEQCKEPKPCDVLDDYGQPCVRTDGCNQEHPYRQKDTENRVRACGPYCKWQGHCEGYASRQVEVDEAKAKGREEENNEWRRLLWLGHGCPIESLYGDDGEMQCNNCGCFMDFKRDPIEKIIRHLSSRYAKGVWDVAVWLREQVAEEPRGHGSWEMIVQVLGHDLAKWLSSREMKRPS
jgi:hypothetical protein